MNAAPDLAGRSAVDLARLIASGEVSSAEVVGAHISRIEQVNSKLNAVVVPRFEAARAEARAADEARARGGASGLGPLHGVPVTIKESLDLAGTPSTFGLPSRARALAESDEVHVARLRAAGAIVLGKTNASQLLLFTEADNPLYGRTQNPWDLARAPGGSSGGEGAIIAAGGSPLGLGTDMGGSSRSPAASCGIVGFKATAGRLDDPGLFSVPAGQRAVPSQVGVLGRDVASVALGLEVANGGRDPAVLPPLPLGDFRAVDVAKLRVAFHADDGTFAPSPANRRAVREAASTLEGAGARVVEWTPPDVPHALGLYYGLLSAAGRPGLRRALGRDPRDPRILDIERALGATGLLGVAVRLALRLLGQRYTLGIARSARPSDALGYFALVEAQMEYRRRFADALDRAEGGPFDAILGPGGALPAFVHGASRDLGIAGAYFALHNLLGYPAGVVPVTRVRPDEAVPRPASRDWAERAAARCEEGSAGLPIAVQVAARPWREDVALALLAALEAAARARGEDFRGPLAV